MLTNTFHTECVAAPLKTDTPSSDVALLSHSLWNVNLNMYFALPLCYFLHSTNKNLQKYWYYLRPIATKNFVVRNERATESLPSRDLHDYKVGIIYDRKVKGTKVWWLFFAKLILILIITCQFFRTFLSRTFTRMWHYMTLFCNRRNPSASPFPSVLFARWLLKSTQDLTRMLIPF
jgi:hypothetical protein